MRDLSRESGLSRQTIHFYIREGVLMAGEKHTANSAVYGEIHTRRLTLIRRLREDHHLPISTIRALIEGDATVAAIHRTAFERLRAEIEKPTIPEDEALPVDPRDLVALLRLEAIDPRGPQNLEDDVELARQLGRLRRTWEAEGRTPLALTPVVAASKQLVEQQSQVLGDAPSAELQGAFEQFVSSLMATLRKSATA